MKLELLLHNKYTYQNRRNYLTQCFIREICRRKQRAIKNKIGKVIERHLNHIKIKVTLTVKQLAEEIMPSEKCLLYDNENLSSYYEIHKTQHWICLCKFSIESVKEV